MRRSVKFMENQNLKIRVFSTPACPYCVTLKNFLEEKGFKYENIDVSNDQKAAKEMIEKTGQMGVPVIDVDGTIVIGFDVNKLKGLLKIE